MSTNLTVASKYLSFLLRHKPESIGLSIDPEGWAKIEEVLELSEIGLTDSLLKLVVEKNDKNRFEVSSDGLFIRANQGHSFEVNLGLQPTEPPTYLFHGTASRFVDNIKLNGLLPRDRQYVHLSADRETAINVGKRHGKPVLLRILSLAMHRDGHQFFQASNGIWMTKSVPPEVILDPIP